MKLLILEEITDFLAKEVIEKIAANTDPIIDVLIMSPGGSVFAGNAIISALKGADAVVNTRVIGMAASMAAVIAQVGELREIDKDARFLLHFGSLGTPGRGTAEDHQKSIDILKGVNDMLLDKLKGTMKKAELVALLKEDRAMTAKEAVNLGFFDTITEPLKAVALLNSENMKTKEQKGIIAQAKALLGITEPKDDEEKKLIADMLKVTEAKAAAEALARVEAAKGKEGAEVLTAEMVSTKEFLAYKETYTPLMASLLNLLEEMPSTEEIEAMVEKRAEEAVTNVLKKLQSKSTAPTASTFPTGKEEKVIKDDHAEWNERLVKINNNKS